jgi:hypothetical protein
MLGLFVLTASKLITSVDRAPEAWTRTPVTCVSVATETVWPSRGPEQAATVAPGNAQTVDFAPPRILPNGPWTAQIKLKSGLLEREATATVAFPEAGPGERVAPVNEDGTQWVFQVAIAAGLVVALGAAVWLVLHRQRRSRAAAALPRTRASKHDRDHSSMPE